MKKIYICWTGGWDSTYRVVELSRMEVEVCPIYVREPTRKSYQYELNSMNRILTILAKKPQTRAVLNSVRIVNYDDISEDDKVQAAYSRAIEFVKLGSQYEYLARVAKMFPGIEIGAIKPMGEYSGIKALFDLQAKKVVVDGVCHLDKSGTGEECWELFGNMSFPIIGKTEWDMRDNIKEWGCEDVMREIHFCHRPLRGRPCGVCRACEQKMEGKMEFLLPWRARFFYRLSRCMPNGYMRKIFIWGIYKFFPL